MQNNSIIISVKNISKKYKIHKKEPESCNSFFALNNISFDVEKGKILGIIGGNGAGKSTLLKILSEVVPPTSGKIDYNGTILSILEIGTGFHQDLSGYENIFLNASLLGRKKKDTEKIIDEIIEFSGISNFIHESVKSYSSGMYLRLALSIALFIDYDIILLDEVVSVGDVDFRLKAVKKLKERAQLGKACIMISHDLQSISELCDSCILLEKGEIKFIGNTNLAIEHYNESVYNKNIFPQINLQHHSCELLSVKSECETYITSDIIKIMFNIKVKRKDDIRIILRLRSYQTPVLTDSFAFRQEYAPHLLEPGNYCYTCSIPSNLLNASHYMIDIIVGNESEIFIEAESIEKFIVRFEEWEMNKNWNSTGIFYPVRSKCNWELTAINDQDQ